MFVKISKGDGRWLLLNDVRSIDYSSVSRSASSAKEFQQQVDVARAKVNGCEVHDALIGIDWQNPPSSISEERPYRFSSMTVEQADGKKTLVLFDHPVYLCDNNGKTVEKISVRDR